ncbi:hypothetical protein FISHEDRAFT_63007 [Fistulina hepatica ATCC 64428]|uniref:Rpr2-domain-containing protein n=1 Tax=Fistulina hepatica ATCC 64428 TaxID=1128425 RepID=A0A0D6ZYU2_9AGAR|nr:hypothetical protein FISHEDRAFT_63007 [Fistulina hepatica ATCC 64428]
MEEIESDATISFQETVPYALLNVSPELAALHTSRIRRSSTAARAHLTDFCSKCGAYSLSGDSRTRICRLSASSRMLQRQCLVCGQMDSTALDRGNAALFPRRRRRSLASRSQESPSHVASSLTAELRREETMLSSPESNASKPQGPHCIEASLSSNDKSIHVRDAPSNVPPPSPPVASLKPSTPLKNRATASSTTPLEPERTTKTARSKKKSALQNMLAKNRAKEQRQRDAGNGGGGLAAFLSGL